MSKVNRYRSILFFALCVVLLMVVSARVSPGEARDADTPRETRFLMDADLLPAQSPAEATPEVTEPMPVSGTPEGEGIRAIFPNANISDWNLRLVNQTYTLNPSFAPTLAEARDGEYFDARAAEALEAMLSAAEAAGQKVCVRAGYRNYQTQAYLFFGRATMISENENIDYSEAEDLARRIVAYPGTSEHQTGLAVDIMDTHTTAMTVEEAENLPVLKWLQANCGEYGFIYRYPAEKQEITGWYEPWHFRYVGKEAASYMMENHLCLEEFIAMF